MQPINNNNVNTPDGLETLMDEKDAFMHQYGNGNVELVHCSLIKKVVFAKKAIFIGLLGVLVKVTRVF